LPACDVLWGPVGYGPEEQEGEDERDGEEGCDAVAGEVV
jgi:hypothetical protein